MKSIKYLAAALLVWCIAGCAGKADIDQPSSVLISEGSALMENKKYDKAAEKFEAAIINADTPQEAQSAQKLLADSYYLDEAYLDAIAAYEVYNDLYYQDPDTPDIIYRLGMAYSEIALNAYRDQTFATKSVDYFDQLKATYPDNYTQYNAEPVWQKMRNTLAEHEYQVGKFYRRISAPESAVRRFRYMIDNFPDSPRLEDSYVLMVECAIDIDNATAAAVDYLNELKSRFPENKEIPNLTKQLEKQTRK